MIKKALFALTLAAFVVPASAFAYTGTITFKGGCRVSNTGSCTLSVSGTEGAVKIYAATSANGRFGAVSNPFTAPGTKRIANSKNNVCFYARPVSSSNSSVRTRIICLAN